MLAEKIAEVEAEIEATYATALSSIDTAKAELAGFAALTDRLSVIPAEAQTTEAMAVAQIEALLAELDALR